MAPRQLGPAGCRGAGPLALAAAAAACGAASCLWAGPARCAGAPLAGAAPPAAVPLALGGALGSAAGAAASGRARPWPRPTAALAGAFGGPADVSRARGRASNPSSRLHAAPDTSVPVRRGTFQAPWGSPRERRGNVYESWKRRKAEEAEAAFAKRVKRWERPTWSPPPSVGRTREEIWENAAEAAVSGFVDGGLNASCVLLPSGVGEVSVGLRVVLGLMARQQSPLRAIVVVPDSWFALAERLYSDHAGEHLNVVSFDSEQGAVGVRQMAEFLFPADRSIVILSRYVDARYIGAAQERAKAPPLDVVIFEAAHVFRSGAFGEGIYTHTVKSTRRLYMSTRALSGAAPGSLLKSWEELSKVEPPGSTPLERFGPTVYRLGHRDAEELQITVPLRMSFLTETTSVDDVAQEIAALHRKLNISTFKILPPRDGLANAVNRVLGNLTEAKCIISTGTDGDEAAGLDAIILAEGGSSYAALAHEFFRLAKHAPGKRAGFVFLGSGAMEHAVAAWQALAIERFDVEQAIQTATVETGRKNNRLRSWAHCKSRGRLENVHVQNMLVGAGGGVITG
ncbi:unnamed protein product [Prorocentrum cordatum]|uniref:Uncharacterized protein n=1 Tax=Prorocentrum cordatum TaxID=2364126 RepID=A0ABN9WSN1_9DINO|nr:unnamed protein product [Polarella glacialis]